MKIGDVVAVRVRITEIIEREDGKWITVKPLKMDGGEFFNSMTVKQRAVAELPGGSDESSKYVV